MKACLGFRFVQKSGAYDSSLTGLMPQNCNIVFWWCQTGVDQHCGLQLPLTKKEVSVVSFILLALSYVYLPKKKCANFS